MSDDLIKRLRDNAWAAYSGRDVIKAADLIEQQADQLLDARRTAEYWKAEHNAANARIAELEAQIATVAPAVDARPVWISVDDRLPDEGQSVAFVVSSASPTFAYLNGRVLGGYFGHVARHPTFSVPGLGLHASHWMPLPTPPHQDPQ